MKDVETLMEAARAEKDKVREDRFVTYVFDLLTDIEEHENKIRNLNKQLADLQERYKNGETL